MTLFDLLLLALAGFAAGGMNALAGGGTFFSFPALLGVGLPPVTAGATNAVALWPASLAGAWAARGSLRPLGGYQLPLLAAGQAGGLQMAVRLAAAAQGIHGIAAQQQGIFGTEQAQAHMRAILACLENHIAQIESQIRAFLKSTPDLARHEQTLAAIPGIGPVVAKFARLESMHAAMASAERRACRAIMTRSPAAPASGQRLTMRVGNTGARCCRQRRAVCQLPLLSSRSDGPTITT